MIWKPNVTVAAVVERDGRFLLVEEDTAHDAGRTLDEGIVRAAWLTPEEMRREAARHRSPLAMRCVDDYLAGRRYPLAALHHEAS